MTSRTIDHTVPVFSCLETVRRLWDYLDRELSAEDMQAIDAHLAECAKCPPHFAFEQAFLLAVNAAQSQTPAGNDLRSRVRAALGLDADGAPSPDHVHA